MSNDDDSRDHHHRILHHGGIHGNFISSPASAIDVLLSSPSPGSATLVSSPSRGSSSKLSGVGYRSTPSIPGSLSNLSASFASSSLFGGLMEDDATIVIRSSSWFLKGRSRSYHDDDFFVRMAKVAQAIMPLLLASSNKLFSQTTSTSLSVATEKLKLDHSSELSAPRKKYSREFELFICNILKKTGLSSIVLLLALKYIHRLRLAYPGVCPTSGSEYRLFSVAMILANKYLEDRTFTNKTWASLTAMPISEVNIMEREFLTILDFNLGVNEVEFSSWISAIEDFLKEFGTPSWQPEDLLAIDARS